MANFQFNTFEATTSQKVIIASNSNRKGFNLHNTSAIECFWGFDSTLTTANGFPLLPSASHFNSGRRDGWRGAVHIIAASGTPDIRFQEWGE